jgi:hypothetical protein
VFLEHFMGLRLPVPVRQAHLEVYPVENHEERGNTPPLAKIKTQCVVAYIIAHSVIDHGIRNTPYSSSVS